MVQPTRREHIVQCLAVLPEPFTAEDVLAAANRALSWGVLRREVSSVLREYAVRVDGGLWRRAR